MYMLRLNRREKAAKIGLLEKDIDPGLQYPDPADTCFCRITEENIIVAVFNEIDGNHI